MRRRQPRLWLPTTFVVAYLALGWLIYQQLTGAPNTEALARIQLEQVPALKELPPELQFTLAAIEDFDSVSAPAQIRFQVEDRIVLIGLLAERPGCGHQRGKN